MMQVVPGGVIKKKNKKKLKTGIEKRKTRLHEDLSLLNSVRGGGDSSKSHCWGVQQRGILGSLSLQPLDIVCMPRNVENIN